ncbi:hypothetical protein, partial [Brevundimonas kwangchunensis]|uniref:hypothetical protein n=1 Tax=Brevundimonas kwangchunensis TaxID=322163 RepID=UPI0031DA33A9
MRLMLVSAAAALTLAACNREPAPEAPAEDTAAMEAAPTDAGAPAPAPAASGSGGSAAAASDAGVDTAGTAPASEGMMSGPSEATRDAAKEKAEQTNLHPRT